VPIRHAFAIACALVVLTGCGSRTGFMPGSLEIDAGPADAGSVTVDEDAGPPAPPPCVPGAAPSAIATISPFASVLAVDDQSVYFIANGEDAGVFSSIPKGGGPVRSLAAAPPPNVDQLAVDGTTLYALDYSEGLYSVPKLGGPATQLTPGAPIGTAGMGLDDDSVYYSDVTDVWRVPKQGGARVLVLGGPGVTTQDQLMLNLRLVGDNLYWSQPDGGLYMSAKDGSNSHLIATVDPAGGGEADEFVTDGTTEYAWIDVFTTPEIISLPVNAGTPVATLGAYEGNRGFFEDDALITPTTVYFTGWPANGNGTADQGIYALARSTGTITEVSAGQIVVVEQDDTCLYWIDGDQLFTVAK
jgi:hypothetical protein